MPHCHHILFFPSQSTHIIFFRFFSLMSSSNIDPCSNNINNGTLPLRSSAYSCPNSTQLTTTTMSTIDRPNSNSSNVYQTIDADRLVTSLLFFSISMFDVHYSNKHRQECIHVIYAHYHQTVRHIYKERELLVVHPE